jgi:hypothetical protein
MLRRPVPPRFRFFGPEERAGRGRLAVWLWVFGSYARSMACAFAMAEGFGVSADREQTVSLARHNVGRDDAFRPPPSVMML